jgi:hypothetical protein
MKHHGMTTNQEKLNRIYLQGICRCNGRDGLKSSNDIVTEKKASEDSKAH